MRSTRYLRSLVIAFGHILAHTGMEETILSPKPALVFSGKLLEVIRGNTVKNLCSG